MDEILRQWMPHGQCVAWTPRLLIPQIVGEAMIFCAYMLIPAGLAHHVWRHWRTIGATTGPRMVGLYWWFAAFILFCGVGHALNIVTVWWGVYQLTAFWSLATGIVSLITVERLWRSQTDSEALWAVPEWEAAVDRMATAAAALAVHLHEREHDR